jgi:N-methylhydantoinase B
MTNTANTPVEALERTHPIRVWRFELRNASGGEGQHHGGDGVVKEVEFMVPTTVSIVGDRRSVGPPGAAGGRSGKAATDSVIRDGEQAVDLPYPAQARLAPGDRIRIQTPGGGGWGTPERQASG